MAKRDGLAVWQLLLLCAGTGVVMLVCICVGSVAVPAAEVFRILLQGAGKASGNAGEFQSIILSVRLPRVICAALSGASLSLCGCAMQGLLRNPLADAATLGVSSGAALGAVLAIAFGLQVPGFRGSGSTSMAILFSFLSLLLVLGLTHRLDYSFSTNTIVLIGIVFSMFASSMISLVITFAGEKANQIVFWTLGSLASANYTQACILAAGLIGCGFLLLRYSHELNAFAISEDNARHVGIDVRNIKLMVLLSSSILIGLCVSVGGTINFVGLVIPHITRMATGPNHKKLLPASLFTGASFLMLADLAGRTILSPRELPIGVVTSIIGSVVFISIFYSARKVRS